MTENQSYITVRASQVEAWCNKVIKFILDTRENAWKKLREDHGVGTKWTWRGRAEYVRSDKELKSFAYDGFFRVYDIDIWEHQLKHAKDIKRLAQHAQDGLVHLTAEDLRTIDP